MSHEMKRSDQNGIQDWTNQPASRPLFSREEILHGPFRVGDQISPIDPRTRGKESGNEMSRGTKVAIRIGAGVLVLSGVASGAHLASESMGARNARFAEQNRPATEILTGGALDVLDVVASATDFLSGDKPLTSDGTVYFGRGNDGTPLTGPSGNRARLSGHAQVDSGEVAASITVESPTSVKGLSVMRQTQIHTSWAVPRETLQKYVEDGKLSKTELREIVDDLKASSAVPNRLSRHSTVRDNTGKQVPGFYYDYAYRGGSLGLVEEGGSSWRVTDVDIANDAASELKDDAQSAQQVVSSQKRV